MQLVKIVSITNVLKSECVNIRIAKRRKELNGEKIKQAGDELNRKIVLFRLTTTNAYEWQKNRISLLCRMKVYIRILSDNTNRFLQWVFRLIQQEIWFVEHVVMFDQRPILYLAFVLDRFVYVWRIFSLNDVDQYHLHVLFVVVIVQKQYVRLLLVDNVQYDVMIRV